jgi:hypothetical protein
MYLYLHLPALQFLSVCLLAISTYVYLPSTFLPAQQFTCPSTNTPIYPSTFQFLHPPSQTYQLTFPSLFLSFSVVSSFLLRILCCSAALSANYEFVTHSEESSYLRETLIFKAGIKLEIPVSLCFSYTRRILSCTVSERTRPNMNWYANNNICAISDDIHIYNKVGVWKTSCIKGSDVEK